MPLLPPRTLTLMLLSVTYRQHVSTVYTAQGLRKRCVLLFLNQAEDTEGHAYLVFDAGLGARGTGCSGRHELLLTTTRLLDTNRR